MCITTPAAQQLSLHCDTTCDCWSKATAGTAPPPVGLYQLRSSLRGSARKSWMLIVTAPPGEAAGTCNHCGALLLLLLQVDVDVYRRVGKVRSEPLPGATSFFQETLLE